MESLMQGESRADSLPPPPAAMHPEAELPPGRAHPRMELAWLQQLGSAPAALPTH